MVHIFDWIMSQKNPAWQSGFFVTRATDYWLVSQAVVVAVFGVAGSFVEVFAGYAVNRIAGEASRGRVAVCYTILAGGRAFAKCRYSRRCSK